MGIEERDREIRRRYYAGESAIELGREYSLSRSQVHRIVAAGPPPEELDDDYGDDDDAGLALLDGTEVDQPGPFTYAGIGDEGS